MDVKIPVPNKMQEIASDAAQDLSAFLAGTIPRFASAEGMRQSRDHALSSLGELYIVLADLRRENESLRHSRGVIAKEVSAQYQKTQEALREVEALKRACAALEEDLKTKANDAAVNRAIVDDLKATNAKLNELMDMAKKNITEQGIFLQEKNSKIEALTREVQYQRSEKGIAQLEVKKLTRKLREKDGILREIRKTQPELTKAVMKEFEERLKPKAKRTKRSK